MGHMNNTSYGIIAFHFNPLCNKVLEDAYVCANQLIKPHVTQKLVHRDGVLVDNKTGYFVNLLRTMPKFVMVSRRLSLGFTQFVSGNYSLTMPNTLGNLIEQMYPSEIELLMTKSYRELLMISSSIGLDDPLNVKHLLAQAKHDILVNIPDNRRNLAWFLKNYSPHYDTQEWGFPKGHRNNKEKMIDCALREFREETGITSDRIHVFDNLEPIVEDMVGTNGVKYHHVYYLATVDAVHEEIQEDTREIGEVRWVTYSECIDLLRPHHPHKHWIMKEVYIFLINTLIEKNVHLIYNS